MWGLAKLSLFTILALVFSLPAYSAPVNFDRAKIEVRQHVYFDRHQSDQGTLYCGCRWAWAGRSGGRVNLASCGYQVRNESQRTRAERIEHEHIVPASLLGQQRQCWQNGGRSNCNRTDPVFNAMEADMHNLSPVIGEVNADRSNFRFGMVSGARGQHGACDVKIDFMNRVVEPRDKVKGRVARVYFYMADRYNLRLSTQQQRLFMAWDKQFPVSEWERERDRRIAVRMGHHNPFVTGARAWSLNYRNTSEGLVSLIPQGHPASSQHNAPNRPATARGDAAVIRGNKNSRVYHLPSGCPSYHHIAEQNIVEFTSEKGAIASGYRKAGNCR